MSITVTPNTLTRGNPYNLDITEISNSLLIKSNPIREVLQPRSMKLL